MSTQPTSTNTEGHSSMATGTTLTKDQMVDAAVALVESRARRAIDGITAPDELNVRSSEYSEAYALVGTLREQGVIDHPDADTRNHTLREAARKSLEGKVKRLLDAEAAKKDARILRFSSRDRKALPHLDGEARYLYGQTVAYTTPELFALATAAVEAVRAREQQQREEMAELLAQAEVAGLPTPSQSNSQAVTYDVDGFRALIALVQS